jgi:nogalonic acid methyl ester cyclase/aklanonic acid methyl ester cyclase
VPTVSDRIDIVRRMVNSYNTGKTDDVAEFIHEEYLNPGALEHMPELRGPEAFALAVKWLKLTFSEDAHLEEIGYEEKGSWVRAKLALYGRQVGELVGMPATGRKFSGEQIHLIRIVDGKIRDHRDWPDYLGTYRQLGEPWPTEEGWRP